MSGLAHRDLQRFKDIENRLMLIEKDMSAFVSMTTQVLERQQKQLESFAVTEVEVEIKRIKRPLNGKELPLPEMKAGPNPGAILTADVPENKPQRLAAGQTVMVPTGVAIYCPKGFQAQIRTLPGLALKNSIYLLNAPYDVAQDYTGELGLIMHNAGKEDFLLRRGWNVAVLVIQKVIVPKFKHVPELSRR